MFISKNLQLNSRRGLSFLKGATLFFLGMSAVMFLTQAFQIVPMTRNVMTLMNKIVLTSDGNPSSPQRIILDGTLGKASFSGDIVAGSGICLGGVCNTSRPVGGSSVWLTGLTNEVYYTQGNVGIGTSTPDQKLTVSGGNLSLNNGVFFSTANATNTSLMVGVSPQAINNIKTGDAILLGTNGLYLIPSTLGILDSSLVVTISSGGRVGIGTGSPAYTLDVAGTGHFNQGIISSTISFHNVYSTSYMKYIPDLSLGDTLTITLLGTEYMRLYKKRTTLNQDSIVINNNNNDIDVVVKGTGDDNLLYIDASKNTVGIGTGNPHPYVKLDVAGDTNVAGELIIGGIFQKNSIERANNDMVFRVNNMPRMRITQLGNVGIGTSTPQAMLTVEGGIQPGSLSYRAIGSSQFTPCNSSNYPPGTIYYNAAAGVMCYCNNSNQPVTMTGGNCVLPEEIAP